MGNTVPQKQTQVLLGIEGLTYLTGQEGSTSQSDAEQARFLGLALRSLVETVACRRLVQRRNYPVAKESFATETEQVGQKLFAKLHAMRRALKGTKV